MKKQKVKVKFVRVRLTPAQKEINNLKMQGSSEHKATVLQREIDNQRIVAQDQAARIQQQNRDSEEPRRQLNAATAERDRTTKLVEKFLSVSITSLDAVVSHTTGESQPAALRRS